MSESEKKKGKKKSNLEEFLAREKAEYEALSDEEKQQRDAETQQMWRDMAVQLGERIRESNIGLAKALDFGHLSKLNEALAKANLDSALGLGRFSNLNKTLGLANLNDTLVRMSENLIRPALDAAAHASRMNELASLAAAARFQIPAHLRDSMPSKEPLTIPIPEVEVKPVPQQVVEALAPYFQQLAQQVEEVKQNQQVLAWLVLRLLNPK